MTESNESAAGATPPKADCYAAGERAWMVRTQAYRARLLGPLLRLLAGWGIQPDHLTLISLVVGLAFCPVYFASPAMAFVLLGLHVAIDGLDGPLARYRNVASRKGSFTDSMADQVVIGASTITLMVAGVVGMIPGTIYIVTYTVVVLFAMARNALNAPYSWLLRPRFFVYAWMVVETWWWPGTLDYLLWGCIAVLSLKAVTGFLGIRNRI